MMAFKIRKEKLVLAPIIITPDWNLPFEMMCDASGLVLGAVLGQCKNKFFHPIYYASKMVNCTQKNYTITEQELLIVVYGFEKFRAYLLGTKVVKDRNGCENQVADHLSRLEADARVVEEKDVDNAFLDESHCVPDVDVNEILEACHDSPTCGHQGAFVQPLKSYNVVTIGQQCSGMLRHFASVVSNVNSKGLYLEDMNCLFHNSLRLNCLMFGE
ncbi:hypothetical protein MTR67_022929 [Solanum verrucosum]|uniref:Reverse transcriptase/retrotransposon-derived protein RNase H-like domain-containing protein n=1 Tax=Solanum verrucosum TaxID=315347 RepID=A0AAF0TRQ8_SOLVR|nr:hypothetical protein MTR67_022929 [Solanum verrucosum]